MSDENDPGSGAMVPAPSAAPSARIDFSAQGMQTTYANFCRISGTFEELLIDFGFHSGVVSTAGPESAKFTNRIVMNFMTAKRLLATLAAAVQRHEQTFGPIETDPAKRVRKTN